MNALQRLVPVVIAVAASIILLSPAHAATEPTPSATLDSTLTVQIPDPSQSNNGNGGNGNPGATVSAPVAGGQNGATIQLPTQGLKGINQNPAADVPPLSITPPRAKPGATIALHAGGFAAAEQVRVVLYPDRTSLGEFAADANGVLNATVTLATKLGGGPYTVEATGLTTGYVTNGTLMVIGGSGSSGGLGSSWWIAVAGGALAVAVILFGILRGWWTITDGRGRGPEAHQGTGVVA